MSEHEKKDQVPDEALGEVAGGRSPIMTYKKRYVCNMCGYTAEVPCTVGIIRDDQAFAQLAHNSCGGKTGTCTDGKMEYKP